MEPSMDQEFVKMCAGFYGNVIGKLSEFCAKHENLNKMSGRTPQDIGQIIHDYMNIQLKTGPPQVNGGLSAAFTTQTMPVGFSNIGAPKKIGGTKVNPIFQSLQTYTEISQNAAVCAYMTNRGDNKDKVCCQPAANHQIEAVTLAWRCVNHIGKPGYIEKKLGPGAKAIPHSSIISGFNTPGQVTFQSGQSAQLNLPMMGGQSFPGQAPAIINPFAQNQQQAPMFAQQGHSVPPPLGFGAPINGFAQHPLSVHQNPGQQAPMFAPQHPLSVHQNPGQQAPMFAPQQQPPSVPQPLNFAPQNSGQQAPMFAPQTTGHSPSRPQPLSFTNPTPLPQAFQAQQSMVPQTLPTVPEPPQLKGIELTNVGADYPEIKILLDSTQNPGIMIKMNENGQITSLGKMIMKDGSTIVKNTLLTRETADMVAISDGDRAYLKSLNID
jgi:hypothetical protein